MSTEIRSGLMIVIAPIQAPAMQTTGVQIVPQLRGAGPVRGQDQSAAEISVTGLEAAAVTVSVTGQEPGEAAGVRLIVREPAAAVSIRVIVREAGKEVPVPAIASEVPVDHLAAISAVRQHPGIVSVAGPAVPLCRAVREAHPVVAAAARVAVAVVSRDAKNV
jgi:hypothetical protein